MRRSSLTLASVPAASSAVMVSIFRRHDVALVRRLAEHSRRAGEERHVTGTKGGIWNLAFGRLGSGFHQLRSGNEAGTGKAGPADGDAERAEKFTSIDSGRFVHGLPP